tara:strand:+ start:4464 stop:4790 length:327 start_codon:yes stop_codon:yes gene_type:complete
MNVFSSTTSPRTTAPPKRHEVLGVWKKSTPVTTTGCDAPDGDATDGRTMCTPPSAGAGSTTIAAMASARRVNAPRALTDLRRIVLLVVSRTPAIARGLFLLRVLRVKV